MCIVLESRLLCGCPDDFWDIRDPCYFHKMNPAEECATIYIDNLIPDRCWMHWSDSEDETDSEDEEGDESGDDEAQQQQQEGDEDEDEDGDDYDDESSEDGIVRTHLPTPEDDPFI